MLSLRASSVTRSQPAFTLLELVIVLVIMVGLTAIAWPNLARQLRKSELRESSQLLRTAIEECGYCAASNGQPVFLKLVEGSAAIEVLAASDLAQEADRSSSKIISGAEFEMVSDIDLRSSSDIDTPVASSDRSWEFSGAVVVRSVRWQIESVKPLFASSLESDGVSEEAYGYSDLPAAEVDTEAELFVLEEKVTSERVWWMPFVAPSIPSGVGREATIELYDEASKESLRVTYDPVSGRVEVLP